ncbi:hypothetical protein [Candidatus Poriferisodalis sp.]|uniref:hypothetical protein n=1 Tax=Candidatus Poriferisodalis sp. TaxID=3101277 RepID=UPI003B02152B
MPQRASGLRAEISETANLLRAYVVQETIGPLRGLGRYVMFGVIGAVGVSLAAVLAALALVRVLQAETGLFNANWSFVPYLAGSALLALAVVLSVRAISTRRPDSSPERASPDPAEHATEDADA